jgi:hypothetical protein
MRRVDRARVIRDYILEKDNQYGSWETAAGYRTRVIRTDRWEASLNSPFNPFPHEAPTGLDFQKAMILQNTKAPLPYLLDLWIPGIGKVLSMEWDDQELRLISMKRGDWESTLFGLPSRD